MSNLPGMAYRCRNDRLWTVEFASQGAMELTGYQPEDLVGNRKISYASLIHRDDRERVWNEIQSCIRNKRPYQLTYRIITAQLREKWVWEQGRGVFTPQGELLALEGFIIDITERRRCEERYRSVFESAPFGIFHSTLKGKLIDVNTAFARIMGYSSPKELISTVNKSSVAECLYVDPELRPKFIAEVLSSGKWRQFENQYRRKDGKIVDGFLRFRAIPKTGNGAELEGFFEDITERKRAEEALRESEERYRSMFENAPFGICRTTVRGKMIDANATFARLLGYSSPEEVLARVNKLGTAEAIYVNPEERPGFIAKVVARKGGWHQFEHLFRRKDGSIVTGSVRFRALPKHSISGAEIEGFFEDVTEKKKAEQELHLYQEKLRVLSAQLAFVEEKERQRLANNIHDYIGQSLACAMLKLGALEKEVALTSEVKDILQEVRAQVEQGIQYARTITFELSPSILYKLGFEAVVEWLADRMQELHGISYQIKSDRNLKIPDNETRVILFRAVRELLMNIVKHSKAQNVFIAMRKKNGSLEISIKDDGTGFDIARSSQKTEGYGLLSVREQMAYIGGSMSIESTGGKGTSVKIVSPLEGAGSKKKKTAHSPASTNS